MFDCPKCKNHRTDVIDSRVGKTFHGIRRRRECADCGWRFSTCEIIENGPVFDAQKREIKAKELIGRLMGLYDETL